MVVKNAIQEEWTFSYTCLFLRTVMHILFIALYAIIKLTYKDNMNLGLFALCCTETSHPDYQVVRN